MDAARERGDRQAGVAIAVMQIAEDRRDPRLSPPLGVLAAWAGDDSAVPPSSRASIASRSIRPITCAVWSRCSSARMRVRASPA